MQEMSQSIRIKLTSMSPLIDSSSDCDVKSLLEHLPIIQGPKEKVLSENPEILYLFR